MTHAVIDAGTNTLILLIAKKNSDKIKTIVDKAVVARLGQGVSDNHFFLPEAMNRAFAVFSDFKKICDKNKVKKIVCVGTAGFRMALNADVFVDRVKKELKIPVKIISGEDEAEYTFLSAHADFCKKQKKLIVIDIGGGSTEIITGPQKNKKVPETVLSLNLGSVLLTERYIKTDPPLRPDLEFLVQSVRKKVFETLNPFYDNKFDFSQNDLVATAGTATTLLALHLKMKKYDPAKIHGGVLPKNGLEKIISNLSILSLAERSKLPGIEPARADVILAGGVLLLELANYFKKDKIIISDKGLRYGVMYEKFFK